MKAIIFDASTLISLTMNGLLGELEKLKEKSKVKFLITDEVKNEIIDRPIKIRRFKLEALKLKELVNKKIIEMPSSVEEDSKEISKQTQEIMQIANSMFEANGKEIKLLQSGESSCIALSKKLQKKKIQNVLAVDERTTRILLEKPENLVKLLERKTHAKIILKKENFKFFKGLKIIRSSEIVYAMHKKGIINLDGKLALDALLYAVKFKGCAISNEEIEEIEKIG